MSEGAPVTPMQPGGAVRDGSTQDGTGVASRPGDRRPHEAHSRGMPTPDVDPETNREAADGLDQEFMASVERKQVAWDLGHGE